MHSVNLEKTMPFVHQLYPFSISRRACGDVVLIPTFPFASTVKSEEVAKAELVVVATLNIGLVLHIHHVL